MDMHTVMQKLSEKRPIFRLEPEFQLALAHEIHSLYPLAKVGLEGQPLDLNGQLLLEKQGQSIDIFFWLENHLYIIELKYRTEELSTTVEGEEFYLKKDGEKNNARDGFYKDISRIEKAARYRNFKEGYAIFLTNAPHYWDKKEDGFSLHEGAKIKGTHKWLSSNTGLSQRKEIIFNKDYSVKWEKYSEVKPQDCIGPAKNCSFKYALIVVN